MWVLVLCVVCGVRCEMLQEKESSGPRMGVGRWKDADYSYSTVLSTCTVVGGDRAKQDKTQPSCCNCNL